MAFLERLQRRVAEGRTHLCVGLDPDLDRLPEPLPKTAEGVRQFLEGIIESTCALACVYKPNLAFYGALGTEGMAVLERTIRFAGERCPVILDGKFGDIGNTAKAYARMAFEKFGADAVTLNPYMGSDSLAPFVEREDGFAFVLGVTSNPSSSEIQKRVTGGGRPLFEAVAEELENHFPSENWGWVAGATQAHEMKRLRAKSPERWFLIPGVGAQGGGVEESMENSVSRSGARLAVINASRSILYASAGPDYREAAQKAAEELVTQMRKFA